MSSSLSHINGPPAWPLVGHTLTFLNDSDKLHGGALRNHGPIYKVKLAGRWSVALAGADALEFVLGNTDGLFSSEKGWYLLRGLFDGGLLLRDFDDHRAHRRIMQAAFRKPVLDSYRDMMIPALASLIDDWPQDTPFAFYPAIKKTTLQMGAAVFMGLDLRDPLVPQLNDAFQAEVAATLGLVRMPLPLTKMGAGVKARDFLSGTFRRMIPERRASGGDDFFSQMCIARDADGNRWSEAEIIDHFNLLLMAAHDTTASTLTKMVWAIGAHPDWQARMIAEVDALGDAALDDAALGRLDVIERVMKECLRLLPPVPYIPRRATRAFQYGSVTIPADTGIVVMPRQVMMSPDYWTSPERFDPDRFLPDRAEDKSHRLAWAPFGAGAHKCIGLHFATTQVKVFMTLLLRRYRVVLQQSGPVRWQNVPIGHPRGGLPISLVPRSAPVG